MARRIRSEFDHADGASGGTFNLAMYCQGMSGTQIADNWRNIPIKNGVEFNWMQYQGDLCAIDSQDGSLEKLVFTAWGLDWQKIQSSQLTASFNVYNFSKHRLEIFALVK